MGKKKLVGLMLASSMLLVACGSGDEAEEDTSMEEETEQLENKSVEDSIKHVYGDKLLDIEHTEEDVYKIKVDGLVGWNNEMMVKSAFHDAFKLLESVYDKDFNNIEIVHQVELKNSYGETKGAEGVKYVFSRENVDKMNLDNMLPQDLPDVADEYEVNPVLLK